MCDTFVLTAEATADGVPLFGKNSDREPNEAQRVVWFPPTDHPPGSTVRCTYLEIPQAPRTHGVLLCQPFWMWGAEMGVNDQGLAIGNEAVFTKIPYDKRGRLTGMDLLRLGLERAATAPEAVHRITKLLARHGQGGNCGFRRRFFYHNSFLLADPAEAWLLETAGSHWAARRIRGVYAISNGLTMGRDWDRASPDLVSHALGRGLCSSEATFFLERAYTDWLFTTFSDCRRRRSRAMDLLTACRGKAVLADVLRILRDHGPDPAWRPDRGLTGAAICMHAGFGPVRVSQTTGSLAAHLHPARPTCFVTATAAPCTGVFKPVWPDMPVPDTGPPPAGTADGASLFWRHETIHRAVLADLPAHLAAYASERDALERAFVDDALGMAGAEPPARAAFARDCFQKAEAAEARWNDALQKAPGRQESRWPHRLAWAAFNRQAGFPPKAS